MAVDFEDLLEQAFADTLARGRDGRVDPQSILLASVLDSLSSSRQQQSLITAPRTDAYGNVTKYDPVRGWFTEKTPTSQAILDAEQVEQLLAAREDAPRNRAALERQDQRSIQANDAFEQAFNNYRYAPKRSEQDFIADAQRSAVQDRQQGLDRVGELVSRQALRAGGGNNAADFASAFRGLSEGAFDGVTSAAKRQGMQDFATFEGARNNRAQNELSMLSGLAGQDGRSGYSPSGLANTFDTSTTQGLTALIQAMMSADKTRAEAAQLAAKAMTTGRGGGGGE